MDIFFKLIFTLILFLSSLTTNLMSFIAAAELFDRDSMESILSNDQTYVNEQNAMGDTALHICLAREDFVRFLLNAKASPNVQNNVGSTPLHRAVAMNSGKTVELLLRAKGDPTIKNNCGFLPEAYASHSNTFNALVAGHKKEVTVPLLQKSGLIIGSKGSTLLKIRAESSAFIEIPKDALEPCAIITGRPENVARARALIMEILYPKKNRVCLQKLLLL